MLWHPYRYGPHPAQAADLALPDGAPRGVAIMLHGGFWRARYDRCLQHAVAADLLRNGWAVWNVDYRGVPPGPLDGGGWPRTHQDVAAGVDLLVVAGGDHGLGALVADPARVLVIGHSAGGCLALWTAARHRFPAAPGVPGAAPLVRPGAVVAQAAVCDLVAGVQDGLGGGAIEAMMGALPGEDPAAYALASPVALLPLGVPGLLVTGEYDAVVPVAQSRSYAAAARAAGDPVTVEVIPGEGHFAHLDPTSVSWQVVRSWLSDPSARMLG
ncbi:MAG TPA: alpha/beta hydrolase [Kineosporiaceae bacterium]